MSTVISIPPAPRPPVRLFVEPKGEAPIRAELYGLEHLESHARELAGAFPVSRERGTPVLLRRFGRNARFLTQAYRRIAASEIPKEALTSDAEWILDNYYVIEEVLREVKLDLPRGFYKELPKLVGGPFAGYPRIYALALSLIAHTDSNLDETHITRFVQAYQSVAPLTIGELWAVPTMLRLGLIENLRRLAGQMLCAWDECARAARWADEHLRGRPGVPPRPPVAPSQCLADPFVVGLVPLLRDPHAAVASAVAWLEDHLATHGTNTIEVVRREHQRQAANQVSIGNSVTSLRLLSALDWNLFFEKTSLVELILRRDPSDVYARQDFATRDRYRRSVETLARGSNRSERHVAEQAIELAHTGPADDARRRHIGFYLVDQGRDLLQTRLGYVARPRDRFRAAVLQDPYACYFGGIAAAGGVTVLLLLLLSGGGLSWWTLLALLVLLAPASEVAVGLANYLVTLILPPRVLPKLDFKQGIPADCTTCVVMPTLLSSPQSATILLERLELHHLTNPDANLRFALLTDFSDAPAETMPEDESILRAALEQIQSLNHRHPGNGQPRFFLFHRRRLWNPVQGCWMGWERKRGKLIEFNRLLRGDRSTSYQWMSGDPEQLGEVRFVLTLDADTRLPRETARRLVATLAHPLNRPRFDPERKRVVEGYGILQPRVSFYLAAALRSLFARIFSASKGIDPYLAAVSDVYQDLFGAGSYTGKGLYDVDAFQAAVSRAFPDNHILSHDLIESTYARCGLVTDVEVMDDFPARYHTYARREHRWARGDWQLLPWLFRRVPAQGSEQAAPNPLPLLERWKVFDNLRRTMIPPALVILLVLGWTVLPGSPWLWTAFVLMVLGMPIVLQVVGGALHSLKSLSFRPIVRLAKDDLSATAGQVALATVFLADQARLLVDASGRTIYRLFVSRRRLLEWETAAAAESRLGTEFAHFCRSMWPTSLLAVVLGGIVIASSSQGRWAALPILAVWLLSPLVAYAVSRPIIRPRPVLPGETKGELRRLARRTWNFFEEFVGDTDHWLPPDNYQEEPKNQIAHRTSPTNQGLLLLSTLAAHDLGYIGLGTLVRRLEKTFDTLERLERYHGHFHNWYDTLTLKSLSPGYISTVDSGNLMACLLALAQGLEEKAREPIPNSALREGLQDTLTLLADALRAAEPPTQPAPLEVFQQLDADVRTLQQLLGEGKPESREASAAWLGRLEQAASDIPARARQLCDAIKEAPEELICWSERFLAQVRDHRTDVRVQTDRDDAAVEVHPRLQVLARRAEALTRDMDFRFLYNEERHLFSVGFNLAQNRLDNAHYDLLASEACLASYLAIARGDAPVRHWFQLGRPCTHIGGHTVLLSWGGTLFEYLMPRLLLRTYPGTLLDASERAAVARQIQYGRQKKVPWGISESAFNFLDGALDYQYRSFGVPGLGLKRGLGLDLVVAPYATALALTVDPQSAVANFRRLADEGAFDAHGWYEALDYTKERLLKGQRVHIIKSHMAHHQGMTLVALANCLLGDVMSQRFHAAPLVRSAEMLLQERPPIGGALRELPEPEQAPLSTTSERPRHLSRRLTTAATPTPRTNLLSNGRYTVMVTNSGAGFSICDGMDVTRWREDRTRDNWGQFFYVRDMRGGLLWSAGWQPIGRTPDHYEVGYYADKADIRRRDAGIETHLEITVSPEKNVEVRQLTLTNGHLRPCELEVTSYAEVVLNPHGADLVHPAFGNLFVQTEWLPASSALLCHRRTRSMEQKPVWAFHVLALDGTPVGSPQYETDRARFLGRNRTPADPQALDVYAQLSGATGPVLDPIFSLRQRVRLEPGGAVRLAFSTGVAENREEALALADRYHDFQAAVRSFELAWAHAQVELRHLQASAEELHSYQRLAAHLIYAGPALRAPAGVLASNRLGQPALWRHGISGDKPIVVVRISEAEQLDLVHQLVLAHSYWRLKGLEVDLVVLNEHPASYFAELQEQLQNLARASDAHLLLDKPGGVFLRKADQLSEEDKTVLLAAARAVLSGERGSLTNQLDALERAVTLPPQLETIQRAAVRVTRDSSPSGRPVPLNLAFWNGWGGFTPDGREYIVRLDSERKHTPAPWINVVANPACGFLISESGCGYTWVGNSQANRLTPWNNDPVSDSPGEIVYLRDEATGEVWTPTPLPIRSDGPTVIRHGQGYSVFDQTSHGLAQELLLFVPCEDPVKLIRLRIRNSGKQQRRLSATFYAEWVLGGVRDQTQMHVLTETDPETRALLARNAFNSGYPAAVAFADVNVPARTVTADRTEFLGRNGQASNPAALSRHALSGRVGAALDPCAALQVKWELRPGEEKEIVFLLGQAPTIGEVRTLIRRYRDPRRVQAGLDEVKSFWDRTLTAVQVRTPDAGMDLLLNRWLVYQVLSCRLWARSAFYQSGGAYGFRDQLQDVMALVYAAPRETRAQIVRAAGRQFLEGDVQHWWHQPDGRGVRTHFSDDLLWLPFVVCHYVAVTGDTGILDEQTPFLRAPVLEADKEDQYGTPEATGETATVYEHCVRALDRGYTQGSHGLPLMGCGDWNDGMNRVGAGGKGESVWDAWFLIDILRRFAELADARGDKDRATNSRERAELLHKAVEANAWDGGWYRRAYFDDGTPLGSSQNDECQIDSIVQSWAVLAGVADPERSRQAMQALEERLVKERERLILLFDPPFDKGPLHPGYIKGYVPGIRENGGQYTHAATWVVQAVALQGRGKRALELFDMLNPINHARTEEDAARYRVEPYVVAADIYSQPPHVGRGGWTWYTGSAGWLYRVALENLLGFQLRGNRLTLRPCISGNWPQFEITYRYRSTTYHITVLNPRGLEQGKPQITVDGQGVSGDTVELVDDRKGHEVRVELG